MRNKFFIGFLSVLSIIFFISCNTSTNKKRKRIITAETFKNIKSSDTNQFAILYTMSPMQVSCPMPALQSFAFATYNNLWVFIGGQKRGFHGTSNDPPPFRANFANDSIWVVDIVNQKSWAMPVPINFNTILSVDNPGYYQLNNLLYMCGGYTRKSLASEEFDTTSNNFLEINLANLVQYVQTGGNGISFATVITKQIQNPYLQVTGGGLLWVNGHFYLIGGQNYYRAYSAGVNGAYTNAIRKFDVQLQNGMWVIADTASLIDSINLHRRDMNVVPLVGNGPMNAVLYGGVFTKKDEAFRNPVLIYGLANGQPSIVVDSLQQQVNQYSCAYATMSDSVPSFIYTVFFGGISYERYDTTTGKLVVGDGFVPMPFSNLVTNVFSDGQKPSVELIQLPPYGPLLPGYIGSNAVFIPTQDLITGANKKNIDINKVLARTSDENPKVMIGYMVGGIRSLGPTSGTNANGYVPTYASSKVYQVYMGVGPIEQ